MTIQATIDDKDQTPLPKYVVASGDQCPPGLRAIAEPVSIPFTGEDKKDIDTLSCKFDKEKSCSGLAAVQIGIQKRIIVFAAVDDPQTRIWRPDLIDTMPKTMWINPTYHGVEEEGFYEDYEGCFSVKGVAGLVNRYKTILYTAYTIDEVYITGTITGFLARIIQHEIDHLNGILFTDIATSIISIPEYCRIRDEVMARGYR